MKSLTLQIFALILVLQGVAQPVITNFTPVSGPIGTTVTINGTGFSSSAANNIVAFGGIQANVLSATSNSLTVKVPSGATCKPISVTTGGLSVQSTGIFNPTFPGGGVPLTPTAFVPAGGIYSVMSSMVSGVADFNGDGKMDIFCASGFVEGLIVYINNTTGHTISFGQTLVFNTTGTSHLAATAGDLDGDGKPDLIIANDAQVYSLSVYRNTSAGGSVSFAGNQDFAANNSPGEIAIGDIDGDGKPDLVVADGPDEVISFFRNTSTPGNISFDTRVDINAGVFPASIIINDLDGDGKPDLALTSNTGIGVMRNQSVTGSFSFGPLVPCATGNRLVSIHSGDLDGDGKPDLAATDLSGNTITIVKNNSGPGSMAFAAAQTISCFMNTNHIEINDMDGDGKLDLVSSNYNYTNVSVFRNTSTGPSISFDAPSDYLIGNVSLSISLVADMDANGRPDIITGNSGFLFYNNMVGAAPPTITSFTPGAGVTGTVVSIRGQHFSTTTDVRFGGTPAGSYTINSDTLITAIVGGGSSGDLTVENPDATATAVSRFLFYAPQIRDFYPAIGERGTAITIFGSNFTNISTVMFGNDTAASFTVDSLGGITAIVGSGGTGDITVISPNGRTSLAGFSFSPPVINSFAPVAGEVGSVVTITGKNFSPDTALNIVRFGAVKARLLTASATEITVRVPPGASYQPLSVTNDSRRIAFATKPFLVTLPSDDPTITTNSFVPAGIFPTLSNPTDVAIGDLDGDGKPDMVVLEPQTNNFAVYLSRSAVGKIDFAPRIDYFDGEDPIRVLLQDLNGDGRPEIILLQDGPVMGTFTPSQVTVVSNNLFPGGGYIGGHVTLYTTTGTRGICVADMNGDGLPDIVVSNGSTGTITVFPNTTYYGQDDPTFGQQIDYTGMGHPDYIIATDKDQDGRPDIITTNGNANTLTVYRNIALGGKFALANGVDQATAAVPTYITAGDLDGDGLPDFISGENANSAAIADLNGDGKADLGFGRNGSGLISLWQNNYPGTGPLIFTPTVDITAGQGDALYFNSDLDGDSKPDLVVLNPAQQSVSVFRNTIGDPVINTLSEDTAYKGTLIKITGRNFTGGDSVIFGGVPADSIHVVSSSEIDAVVGPGASGNVAVYTKFGTGHIGGFVFIPQIIPQGDTVFCRGLYVTLSSTAASNNQWFKDGIAIPGDTALVADSTGSYTVTTTSNGITTVSPAQQILVKTVPQPTITADADDNLISSALTGNKWYYYNIYPAFDSSRIVRPLQAGPYYVTSTQDGCTSETSPPYYWGGAGAIELPDDQFIRYYPNPVINYLFISQHVNGQPLLMDLSFYDDSGNSLLTVQQTAGAMIDVKAFPVGIIFLHIHADGVNKVDKTVRILKMR